MNKQYTLEDFMNSLDNIVEDLSSWNIDHIHRKDSTVDFRFLKWSKTHLDDVCPRDCDCGLKDFAEKEGDDSFKCEKLEIPYYVQQWSVGDSGDSYSGVMVFDLTDYYVEMSYSM